MKKLQEICESKWVVPCLFLFAFICYVLYTAGVWFALPTMVLSFGIFAATVLVFSEDPKNVIPAILYMPFFIDDIFSNPYWIAYGIAIGFAVFGFVFHIVKKIFFRPRKPLGKFFFPLLVADVGFLLAGIDWNFNVGSFFATFGISFAILFLYWSCSSNSTDLKEFLVWMFFWGAVYLVFAFFTHNAVSGGSITKMFTISKWFMAAGFSITSLYFLLGILSAFELGYKTKYDWLLLIAATIFLYGAFTTTCRTNSAIACVGFAFMFIRSLLKSPNKKNLIICASVIIGISLALFILSLTGLKTPLANIARMFAKPIYNKDGSIGLNGRMGIWKICSEQFVLHPVFGYGFYGPISFKAYYREVSQYFLLAHNTVIQWITSMGIGGSACLVWFYVKKYILLVQSFKYQIYLVCVLLAVALAGMMDESSAMEYYVYSIPIITLAALERQPLPERKLPPIKNQAAA